MRNKMLKSTHHNLTLLSGEVVTDIFQGSDGTRPVQITQFDSDCRYTLILLTSYIPRWCDMYSECSESLWSRRVILAYLHGLCVVRSKELVAVVWTGGISPVLPNIEHCKTERNNVAVAPTVTTVSLLNWFKFVLSQLIVTFIDSSESCDYKHCTSNFWPSS